MTIQKRFFISGSEAVQKLAFVSAERTRNKGFHTPSRCQRDCGTRVQSSALGHHTLYSMRTSYSALGTYKQCPQKYKFQEIDKIPSGKSKEAMFGTLVHEALRFMFQRDPLFPTLDEVLEYFRTHWPTKEKMDWATGDEEELYFKQGESMIKNFYARNAPWNFTVVDLESRFEVVLMDDKNPGLGTHILSGKIDRIDKIGDDQFEVIDYKTGKRMPSQRDIDNDLQLAVYTLGIKSKWPHLKIENIKASLYFLKHGEKLTTQRDVMAVEKTKTGVLKTINEIQDKIASGEKFEPVPSILCNWCSYKPICPMWKHLYKKEAPNEALVKEAVNEYLQLKSQNKKNTERMTEIQGILNHYLDNQELARVFGDEGYVTRTLEKRYEYDYERIRPVLEKIGKWDAVLAADDKKFKEILKTIPEDIREEVAEFKNLSKTYTKFTATKKKTDNHDSPVEDVDRDLSKMEEFA